MFCVGILMKIENRERGIMLYVGKYSMSDNPC
jgi:hypothetical protein